MKKQEPVLLTGDTPSGKLHLGHWVGSLENRIILQEHYKCYFIIANSQAITNNTNNTENIKKNIISMIIDYLSIGIKKENNIIFLQSEIKALHELSLLFSMFTSYSKISRNPTLKQEINDKMKNKKISLGFLMYPITQAADILAFKPDIVPVGEDQKPHLELAIDIANNFNLMVNKNKKIFPIFETKLSKNKRLIGIKPPDKNGIIQKMSKSLNNAIYLTDTKDEIKKKIMLMYTDPNRIKENYPGKTINNPIWVLHETFNTNKKWIIENKEKYEKGMISDTYVKKELIEVIISFLQPIWKKRKIYEKDENEILKIIKKGNIEANIVAEKTLNEIKYILKQIFF